MRSDDNCWMNECLFEMQVFISSLGIHTWIGLTDVLAGKRDWRWVDGTALAKR